MKKDVELKSMRMVPSLPELLINYNGTRIYHTVYKQDCKIYKKKERNKHVANIIYLYKKEYRISHLVYETFIGPIKRAIKYGDRNPLNYDYNNLFPKQLSNAEIYKLKLKKVPDFEDLYINENGTLIVQDNCIIKLRKEKKPNRNLRVIIYEKEKSKEVYVHRLVAKSYIEKKPREDQNMILHIDGDRHNNHFSNLQYANGDELHEWCKKHDLFALDKIHKNQGFGILDSQKITEIIFLLKRGFVLKSIAEKYKTSTRTITRVKEKYMSEEDQKILAEKIKNEDFFVEPEVKKLVVTMLNTKKYSDVYIGKMCSLRLGVVRKIKKEIKNV